MLGFGILPDGWSVMVGCDGNMLCIRLSCSGNLLSRKILGVLRFI